MIDKFEHFQKKCIKWILSEEELSYGIDEIYFKKCRQVNCLPLSLRFTLNDLIFFHKIVNNIIPVSLPEYLTFFNGNTRLRMSHLDKLSLVCSLLPRGPSKTILDKSFFYRTHTVWNSLPLELREIESLTGFRSKLETYLWDSILKRDRSDEQSDLTVA